MGFEKAWEKFELQEMMHKVPSNICGGPKQCADRQGNFEDPFCKECSDDYDAAMEQVRNPTPQMIDETVWLTEMIRGTYNVAGV